jgi:hypothetical protein
MMIQQPPTETMPSCAKKPGLAPRLSRASSPATAKIAAMLATNAPAGPLSPSARQSSSAGSISTASTVSAWAMIRPIIL